MSKRLIAAVMWLGFLGALAAAGHAADEQSRAPAPSAAEAARPAVAPSSSPQRVQSTSVDELSILVVGDFDLIAGADSVILVDPLGRVSTSEGDTGKTAIPNVRRWDEGTETDLDDDGGTPDRTMTGEVRLTLRSPIAGRYLLSVVMTKEGEMWVDVNVTGRVGSDIECPEILLEEHKASGRLRWNIDVLQTKAKAGCPVKVVRVADKEARK